MSSETWRPPTEFAEELRDVYGLNCPPAWGTPRNFERPTLGGKAAKVMQALGCEPMPWQRYVLDVALEVDPDTGLFVYRKVGLSVPRQQGKTETILTIMVHRIMAFSAQNVVYAAQTYGMARKRWEDEFLARLDGSRLYGKYRARKTNGNEAIIWRTSRSRFGVTSNTEKAGHGPPLDLGVIDEAFAHEDDRLEQAMSPAMITRKNAQLWWASAGGTTKSVFLNDRRKQGRELVERAWATGEWPAVCYFEWFAPDFLPRDDPETWRTCMPALGITCSEESVRAELQSMDPAEFDRAYLNRTRMPTPPDDPNIPKREWPKLADGRSQPGADLVFAVDVSQDRSTTSIGVASKRPDGRVHLEVVDRRPGTAWAAPALARLSALWSPLCVAVAGAGSPSQSLIDDIEAAGITVPADKDNPHRGHLVVLRTGDASEAAAQWADSLNQGTAAHIDQAPLTAAVNAARTRRNGDAWTLDRTNSPADIAPLCAVVFARWALLAKGAAVLDDYDVLSSVY
ncbi:terminase large subunit domain-containing protein [Streptomyces sp. NPDC058466]|uniref:terminase large subunit domain-containing protein n=1 Tax=Streptomyces sp. NPDC058466 TaxID=3346512 RepID=UPI00366A2B0F